MRALLLVSLLGGLLLAACTGPATPPAGASPEDAIRLNQVAFYPDGPKVAIVAGAADGAPFAVVGAAGDTVHTGVLGAAEAYRWSEETVRAADFSAVKAPGTYRVVVSGVGASHPFEVRPDALAEAVRRTLKALYYQRASTELPERYAGRWARAAGHPDTAVRVHASAATSERPAESTFASPRGW